MNRGVLLNFFLASALGAGLRFLLFPLLSRSLSPEEFGKVGLYLASSPFVALALGWCLTIPWVIGYHAREERDNRRLLGGIAAWIVVLWALSVPVAWAFPDLLARWFAPGLDAFGIAEATASVALAGISTAYLELDKIRQESRRYLWASLLQTVAQVAGALLAVWWGGPSFAMFVHGTLAANLLVLAIQAGLRITTGPLLPEARATLRLWKAALPVVATTAFALVASLGDRHFVEAAAGLAGVGWFTMAAKLGEIAQQLVHLPVLGAMTPLLLRTFAQERATFADRFEGELQRLAVFSLVATTSLGALIHPLYTLLLPPGYERGAPVTLVFLLAFAVGAGAQGLGLPILAHGRLGTFARFTAVSAVVSLGANALLTPRLGPAGAALAAVLVQVTTLVLTLSTSSRLPGWKPLLAPTWSLLGLSIAIPLLQSITPLWFSDPWSATSCRIMILLGTFGILLSPHLQQVTRQALTRSSSPPPPV